ncbi:hypothetical protein LTR35_018000 [Friedmanniomyces endolithicus]|nr:hypothetical protein LTR35_018000 [Friedmanniomyces endolithicus]KAK0267121.1 hypothetical protein LTS00_017871 [Friedmanniomyces endolithicus]KAK0302767.1 hypothetical protein LTR01_008534 [Friedmanniomyces endolithicus]KAK0823312.1 hypothetical protein LTR73_008627 [Friedmanniomyces endolithicus]KAK0969851.1 hypothetical protein LTR54_018041 [Friedmanniomyces endolithicus]
MTEEMHGLEEDDGEREAHPLCQENQVLRERLTELTKQLAESEGQRITLVETMYDRRCLNFVFARSNMNVSNETESELTRIRDENDSLKRVVSLASVSSRDGHAGIADSAKMSEMSPDSYVGRADPMEVDTEKESTEGKKTPHVLVAMSFDEKGAADVPIGNTATIPQSDASAREEVTMTAKPIPGALRGRDPPWVLCSG